MNGMLKQISTLAQIHADKNESYEFISQRTLFQRALALPLLPCRR
jgi:hypothetical protein